MTSVQDLSGIEEPKVDLDAKTLAAGIDPEKLSLQAIVSAIRGEENTYDARLIIALAEKPSAADLDAFREAAIEQGVRAVSEPDKKFRLLLTFHMDATTRLDSLLSAAKAKGLVLRSQP
ncbi:MAG TPA: hypothetical protein VFG65_01290 [Fimbriimonadales bacterium]|nr:hypothetical protein [Fimbriimonadales bacterium]